MKRLDLQSKALELASKKHKEQKYGKFNFIYHPIQVHDILEMLLEEDENLLAAAYLHDIIEDTDVTYEDLKKDFNEDIADLVREVTKKKSDRKDIPAHFPDLHSRRGIILKFADRLSNLINMNSWDEKKQAWYLKTSKFWRSE